ncbi:MAG: hypothetical protein A3J59_03200 [Candidatus Buchananbacteria bacterium RIFCSPHIGHO2_02_FULL_56_16]|uniref:Uncharacterized protein n=1 Tax=Candidatus Buchananbacteria bacterium RIFCSPHIGHO2_02_FULL_56_16 TaxID=1797542 RepID=A0A1G1YG92_9BACT|nr:MAG: hypothetical protein A3J59_03200 [Candidatus Buchananbacteria bacterium RIFCSPHIGHO2_02_FULL_56_16]
MFNMPKKTLILILSLIILLVAGAGVAYWFFTQQVAVTPEPAAEAPSPPKPSAISSGDFTTDRCAEFTDETLRQRCEEVGLAPLVFALIGEAVEQGAERCGVLIDGGDRDFCIAQVAAEQQDKDLCQTLDQGLRSGCVTQVTVATNNFSDCQHLADAQLAESCRQTIVANNASSDEFCKQLPNAEEQSQCLEIYYTREAVRAEDYGMCAKISRTGGKDRCLNALPPDSDGDGLGDYSERALLKTNPFSADTDEDGLSDYDEVKVHRTKPTVADTDGDGFSDGTEVSAGYDPLK